MKLFTIILFAITYILMIALPKSGPMSRSSPPSSSLSPVRCRCPLSLPPSTGTFF